MLASQHPIEIETGGSHQVKPWFEGKLDFAPVVPAPAGGELGRGSDGAGEVAAATAAPLGP
ncbi:hypothetical protein [Anaeromyxobacter oryzae]|uniref:hypothetical protein n=1 Tax=Anaeromyxobacter oryzae TaxID=2918170 RepID=UPI0020BFA070|nr:hypothetical protein [Anaeromyxobacter oryzae]